MKRSRPRELARYRWRHMISRCTNTADAGWHNYGGRGITVCPRWLESFDAFYADTGDAPEGLTLDRIDNDGNYEPQNVRWATRLQQTQNRRVSNPTHCPAMHPYDEANTYVNPMTGRRACRACKVQWDRRKRDERTPNRRPACELRTHCPQDHPYDEVNTYWHRGSRQCQTCRRERDLIRTDRLRTSA